MRIFLRIHLCRLFSFLATQPVTLSTTFRLHGFSYKDILQALLPGNVHIDEVKVASHRRNSRIVILMASSLSFTHYAGAAVTGPGSAWQYCRKVTLSAATPLANFQVKVTLVTGQYGNMNAAGNDLRFYDINNNACNYWLEAFTNTGTSTIWVNVPTAGSSSIFMYYGNTGATAVSNGATTFDFFDDFAGTSLAANWQQSTSNGTVTVSGSNVTLACNSNSGISYIASAFTPASTSFILETKHEEPKYYRNRFYAANIAFPSNPLGFDNGYFYNGAAGANNSAQVFWNNNFQATVSRNTNYLTQWKITDGSTYIWNTYTYPALGSIQTNNTTYTSLARYITIGVTEANGTSTLVDWVRVRKSNTAFTDPTATIGAQVTTISASIMAQTNVLCNGQSTGSATVTATGGATPYTYSWNSSPTQTAQTATNLAAGTYTATVTESSIGISATAIATITQPIAVTASATSSNINCFNASDGQIQVTGSNGVSPFTFSINNGTAYQSGNSFTNLSPGIYKIRVKDHNGCESALQ